MKKLITLTFALLLVSCAKETAEYTIISGKITGTEENKFNLRGNSFTQEINLNSEGSFTDTLYLTYNGAYQIGRQPIYLEKGKNLSFEADIDNLKDIVFTGDLADENNYIAQKMKLQTEVLGNLRELYALEETEFLSKIEILDQKQNELLEKTVFSAKNFKEKEIQNLGYHKNSTCQNYEEYYSYLTQNSEFKVSENFPKSDQTIDFDNSDAFDFSMDYRMLVSENFDKNVTEQYEKQIRENEDYNQELYNEITLNTYKSIKSQNIKNGLARKMAHGVNPSNPKSDVFYNELITSVTDEDFKSKLTEKYNKIKKLVKGKTSPKFNYENHNGGTTSLDDLKGKYVYIDVWATWCGPCIEEIPFLKEVEEKYHGKNIEFVSISIDVKKDYQKWRTFVEEREMGGIQLYADKNWKSDFVQNYAIEGIPRFILIDPKGNIISADAPRPSDQKLIEMFEEFEL